MFYYKLNTKCTVRQDLLNYANSITDWTPKENLTFLQHTVPREIIDRDTTLKTLADTLNQHYDLGVRIFKMPPWVFYELHTDLFRPASVNMLLNDSSDSVSFFEVGPFRKGQLCIEELSYETDTMYLFNTQQKHAVLNKSEDRYVLSIAMNGLKHFDAALEFIQKNNL